MHRFIPSDRFFQRLVRCVFGLAIFGLGISLILQSNLGAGPWDVFHTGVSELSGIPVGTVIIITGVALLVFWIPLREQPGIGTVLNAVEIGVVVDLTLPLIPEAELLAVRILMLLGGIVAIAIGSGLYIGSGLGPGPRDGLMTGLARRGLSIRSARTGIELFVLFVGITLGGSIGIGTAVFAVAIGPLVHFFLPIFTVKPLTDNTPPGVDAPSQVTP